jgi:hypothetical protein
VSFGPTPIADQLHAEADAEWYGGQNAETLHHLADRVRVLEVAYAGNKLRLRDTEEENDRLKAALAVTP